MTTTALPKSGQQLRSTLHENGELEVSLVDTPVPALGDGEILIRIEATPINPSDIGLLLGPVDMDSLKKRSDSLVGTVHPKVLPAFANRFNQSMSVGNEGAGTVIAGVPSLIGKRVAFWGGGSYAQYRVIKAREVLVLPDDATAAEGASALVNPLTALSMVEVFRRDKAKALVHTAAASSLGQMLVRICSEDGVPLINIVRRAEQVALLRSLGAEHVVDSSTPDFEAKLTGVIGETDASIAFDAIGGATTGQILLAMERAFTKKMTTFSRYGAPTHKQVYLYGGLDTAPLTISRGVGLFFGVSGFLVSSFLPTIGAERVEQLKQRIAKNLKTTFATSYTKTISLADVLDPAVARGYAARATGEKVLVAP